MQPPVCAPSCPADPRASVTVSLCRHVRSAPLNGIPRAGWEHPDPGTCSCVHPPWSWCCATLLVPWPLWRLPGWLLQWDQCALGAVCSSQAAPGAVPCRAGGAWDHQPWRAADAWETGLGASRLHPLRTAAPISGCPRGTRWVPAGPGDSGTGCSARSSHRRALEQEPGPAVKDIHACPSTRSQRLDAVAALAYLGGCELSAPSLRPPAVLVVHPCAGLAQRLRPVPGSQSCLERSRNSLPEITPSVGTAIPSAGICSPCSFPVPPAAQHRSHRPLGR